MVYNVDLFCIISVETNYQKNLSYRFYRNRNSLHKNFITCANYENSEIVKLYLINIIQISTCDVISTGSTLNFILLTL